MMSRIILIMKQDYFMIFKALSRGDGSCGSFLFPAKTVCVCVCLCLTLMLSLILTSCSKAGRNNSSDVFDNFSDISSSPGNTLIINLPDPLLDGNISLESALNKRRSVREYTEEPLTIDQLSQLLWAAQGITGSGSRKTAPSAGALYPLEILVSADNVTGLDFGIYRYVSEDHSLLLIEYGVHNSQLSKAGLDQSAIADAPVCIIITAVFDRITGRYGDRGINYAYVEAGHACQNVLLQAVSLNLGAVPIGAFSDRDISRILQLDNKETPIYLVPVGKTK